MSPSDNFTLRCTLPHLRLLTWAAINGTLRTFGGQCMNPASRSATSYEDVTWRRDRAHPTADAPPSIARKLSRREAQVLALAADGLSSKEIAKRLGLSQRTVDGHFGRIYQRYRVPNRAAAVALWLRECGNGQLSSLAPP